MCPGRGPVTVHFTDGHFKECSGGQVGIVRPVKKHLRVQQEHKRTICIQIRPDQAAVFVNLDERCAGRIVIRKAAHHRPVVASHLHSQTADSIHVLPYQRTRRPNLLDDGAAIRDVLTVNEVGVSERITGTVARGQAKDSRITPHLVAVEVDLGVTVDTSEDRASRDRNKTVGRELEVERPRRCRRSRSKTTAPRRWGQTS